MQRTCSVLLRPRINKRLECLRATTAALTRLAARQNLPQFKTATALDSSMFNSNRGGSAMRSFHFMVPRPGATSGPTDTITTGTEGNHTVHPVRLLDKLLHELYEAMNVNKTERKAVAPGQLPPPRKMRDSFSEVMYPFSTDSSLKFAYSNLFGNFRFGLLLEDLDIFSALVVAKHATTHPIPVTFATASIDRIDIHQELKLVEDLRMQGHVSWVERKTSLSMKAIASHSSRHLIASMKTIPVAGLLAETPEEIAIMKRGEENDQKRKRRRKHLTEEALPTPDEQALIHQLYIDSMTHKREGIYAKQAIYMEDSYMKNVELMQPQEQNLNKKIFGGYLMRVASQLAWTSAYFFSKCEPRFVSVDDISFRKPVNIGDILEFESMVVYSTNEPRAEMQVMVRADVIDPKTSARDTTNVFYFGLKTKDGKPVPRVLPRTYGESLQYVLGKRHHEVGLENSKLDITKNILGPPVSRL